MSKLKIYPNGVDVDGNYTAKVWLSFESKEDRDNYVRKEFKYCRKEEDAHLEARFRKDRIRTKNDLLTKRAKFARENGFEGSVSKNSQWIKGVTH